MAPFIAEAPPAQGSAVRSKRWRGIKTAELRGDCGIKIPCRFVRQAGAAMIASNLAAHEARQASPQHWDSRRFLSVVPGHPAQRPPDQAAEDDRAVAKRVAESP